MKSLKFELFPQFAICPLQGDRDTFTKPPQCAIYNRIYHNATHIPYTVKNLSHKFRDRTFTTTCYLFNSDDSVHVGNQSVACNFLVQENQGRREFQDAEILFSESGSPNWWNFCGDGGEVTTECPDGSNRYRLPRHTFNFISLETISFADDDDAGYADIKDKQFRSKSAGKLDLPDREYKVYGNTIWGGDRQDFTRNNDTEVMIRWQSLDIWQFKPQTAISFWTWISYIGGCLFLLTFLHNIVMSVVRMFLGEEAPNGQEYAQIK